LLIAILSTLSKGHNRSNWARKIKAFKYEEVGEKGLRKLTLKGVDQRLDSY
jgi:hypothetical protein